MKKYLLLTPIFILVCVLFILVVPVFATSSFDTFVVNKSGQNIILGVNGGGGGGTYTFDSYSSLLTAINDKCGGGGQYATDFDNSNNLSTGRNIVYQHPTYNYDLIIEYDLNTNGYISTSGTDFYGYNPSGNFKRLTLEYWHTTNQDYSSLTCYPQSLNYSSHSILNSPRWIFANTYDITYPLGYEGQLFPLTGFNPVPPYTAPQIPQITYALHDKSLSSNATSQKGSADIVAFQYQITPLGESPDNTGCPNSCTKWINNIFSATVPDPNNFISFFDMVLPSYDPITIYWTVTDSTGATRTSYQDISSIPVGSQKDVIPDMTYKVTGSTITATLHYIQPGAFDYVKGVDDFPKYFDSRVSGVVVNYVTPSALRYVLKNSGGTVVDTQYLSFNAEYKYTATTTGNYSLEITPINKATHEQLPDTVEYKIHTLTIALDLSTNNYSVGSTYTDIDCSGNGGTSCIVSQVDCTAINWSTDAGGRLSCELSLAGKKLMQGLNQLFIPTASDINNIFTTFKTSDHGLFAVITAPIASLSTLVTVTCTPINLPLPFVGGTYQLPCMTSFYQSAFGAVFTLYQVIVSGVISYYLLVNFLENAKHFKNPKVDRIQVLDL